MAQSGNASSGNLEERLQALQWQKRVLLLYSPDKKNVHYVQQKDLLEAQRTGLAARDLIQLELFADEAGAATKKFLEEKLKASSNQFNLLLIGKDGGVKYRTTTAAAPETLFSTIDAMPMRQHEMKRRPKPE